MRSGFSTATSSNSGATNRLPGCHSSASSGLTQGSPSRSDHHRCIDDQDAAHAASRPRRTNLADDVFIANGSALPSRSRNSSSDGTAAIFTSSSRIKSLKLLPTKADRALSTRCTRSGTLRTWTFTDLTYSYACSVHYRTCFDPQPNRSRRFTSNAVIPGPSPAAPAMEPDCEGRMPERTSAQLMARRASRRMRRVYPSCRLAET